MVSTPTPAPLNQALDTLIWEEPQWAERGSLAADAASRPSDPATRSND